MNTSGSLNFKITVEEERGNKMGGNQFNIKYRIFKRERVRESKESTSIISKQKSNLDKNQLELGWDNSLLDTSYVSIIGRVMLKEWERVLSDFPIYRAFYHTKNDGEVKLFITFNVTGDLSGEEIKQVVFTATDILNECLEKVAKKVLGKEVFEAKAKENTNVPEAPVSQSPEIQVNQPAKTKPVMNDYEKQLREQDALIKQLTLEVEQQESILKGFTSIESTETQLNSVTNHDMLADINELHGKISSYETQFSLLKSREVNLIEINNKLAEEKANQADLFQQKLAKLEQASQQKIYQLEQLANQKNQQLEQLNGQMKDIVRDNQALTTKLNTNDEINRQLDKANLKLNDMLEQNKVDAKRMAHMAKLEEKIKELEKEKSYFKVQYLDSQRLSKQFENTNRRLNESLERLQSSQSDLVGKARDDYNALDETLQESEKSLKLEVNERQKLEIQLTKLNKNLAAEKLKNEEKNDKFKTLEKDFINRQEEKDALLVTQKELEKALEQKELQVKNVKATNEILNEKLDELEIKKEKWNLMDEWQEKYSLLETRYRELDKEGYSYRQEINLLTAQISKLEGKIKGMPEEVYIKPSEPVEVSKPVFVERMLANNVEKKAVQSKDEDDEYYYEDDYDYDYEYEYFTYEADPYVEDVVTEELMNIRKKDQVKDERKIKAFLEASNERTYTDVKIDATDYKQLILSFKFLSFRWDQVYIMDDADKNSAFLEWCAPYIDEIDEFQEELSYDVKKSLFKKKYVTIDESALNLLKGYSQLSNYLDTYYLRVSYYIDKYFLNEGKK